ncbi:hypothetical protein BG004_001136 [Podila humilis]|nr:hypothetical protein BG004_001136 [Podila humilis]
MWSSSNTKTVRSPPHPSMSGSVEVTVNGQVIDFSMKVGDAGEAFFVFETEQEVPEEFATSPLAGPSQDKAEEDIDFLDLTQDNTPPHTSFVSTHSDHGSDFNVRSFDKGSPRANDNPVNYSGRHGKHPNQHIQNTDQEDSSGILIYPLDVRNLKPGDRASYSHSLPSSPGLRPHELMKNFQPFNQGINRKESAEHDPQPNMGPTTTSPSDTAEHSGFLTPFKDDVIMDMTGYKTDDSAGTDLDSDVLSDGANGLRSRRTERKRKTRRRSPVPFGPAVYKNLNSADVNQHLQPHSIHFTPAGLRSLKANKKRSSSLPNLRDRGVWHIAHRKTSNLSSHSEPIDTIVSQPSLDVPSSSSSTTVSPPPSTEACPHQHRHKHRSHHHPTDVTSSGQKHRHRARQSDEVHIHIPKPLPRTNIAMNALSDTELEFQTPRTAKATQDTEWTWGWGSLPVKSDIIDNISDGKERIPQNPQVPLTIPPVPKPELNELNIDGDIYRVAISLCPGDQFGQDLPLPEETLHQLSMKDSRQLSELGDDRAQTEEPTTRFGALSRWLRGSQTSNQLTTSGGDHRERSPSAGSDARASVDDAQKKHDESKVTTFDGPNSFYDHEPMTRSLSMPIGSQRAGSFSSEGTLAVSMHMSPRHAKRYAKTLRLTSEQLKSLKLQKGANSLTFSVTSSYQGKAVCTAKLFLWEHDCRVVISDIDGTITKSDALGHIFTMAGKDWTHSGVAKLYTDIFNNGYKILYLTSRAIGQADYTRKYLKNVEQDNYQLPDGPVIMSPDRLEIIIRKPQEFKMACLRDIKRLFGDRNPFYAGFGNRITDALSYRSVDVPPSKIFTIAPDGNVTRELLTTYQSSYIALNDLVNEIFPPQRHAPEFNDWNYWKPALPMIELPIAPSSRPVLPKPGESRPSSLHSSFSQNGNIISNGPNRLGVIRSITSSLSFAGPLKKRASIPAFGSSPTTPQMAHSTLSSSHNSTSTSTRSSPTPPLNLPLSAPAGMHIAERTRRLSFSLMKYGSTLSAPSSTSVSTSDVTASNSRDGKGAAITPLQVRPPPPTQRSRGLSFTFVSSGLRESDTLTTAVAAGVEAPISVPLSPTLNASLPSTGPAPHLETVHPLDIPTVRRPSAGFSVSPPQLASRLSETVIPYLRGQNRAKSPVVGRREEVNEGDVYGVDHSEQHRYYSEPLYSEQQREWQGHDVYLQHDEYDEYEEYQGDEEILYDEEGELSEHDDDDGEEDDVELEMNLDAPFL